MAAACIICDRTGKTMKKDDKNAVVSGICFLFHAIILLMTSAVMLAIYFAATASVKDESGNGSYGLFHILFDILVLFTLDIFAIVIIIGTTFAVLYLVTGILIIRKKCGIALAVVSFVVSAANLFIWLITFHSGIEIGLNDIFSIAGTVSFGIFALIIGLPKLSPGKWFVRKFWMAPGLLFLASVVFSIVKLVYYERLGQLSDVTNTFPFSASFSRIILLFLGYFFGGRWMKNEAAADIEKTDIHTDTDQFESSIEDKERWHW